MHIYRDFIDEFIRAFLTSTFSSITITLAVTRARKTIRTFWTQVRVTLAKISRNRPVDTPIKAGASFCTLITLSFPRTKGISVRGPRLDTGTSFFGYFSLNASASISFN